MRKGWGQQDVCPGSLLDIKLSCHLLGWQRPALVCSRVVMSQRGGVALLAELLLYLSFLFLLHVQCEQGRCDLCVSVLSLAPPRTARTGRFVASGDPNISCFVLEECVSHQPCCNSGLGARCCGTGKETAYPKGCAQGHTCGADPNSWLLLGARSSWKMGLESGCVSVLVALELSHCPHHGLQGQQTMSLPAVTSLADLSRCQEEPGQGEKPGRDCGACQEEGRAPSSRRRCLRVCFVASLEALTTKAALGTLPRGSGGTRTRWNDPEAVVAKQKPAAVCSHAGVGLVPRMACL